MSRSTTQPAPDGPSSLRRLARVAGFVGLGVIAILAGASGVIARAPAGTAGVGTALEPPSLGFPFGTDLLGRDAASEMLHALTVTAADAAIAAFVVLVAGSSLGFLAARLPWRIGDLGLWLMGVLNAAPVLLLAILFVGLSSREFAPVAAGLAAAPAAFVRAFRKARELYRSRHAEYARATGIGAMALLRRDLAYEIRDDGISTAARALAAVTITLSTLSFFGFGAVPPARDLGLMIGAARATYLSAWWTAAFPALALILFIFCARLAAGLDEGERP